MRPRPLAIVAATLAIASAGCGGGDEPAPSTASAWADGFCSAVTTWTDELQRIRDELGTPASISLDSLREAVSEVDTATEGFVEEVRGLGAPDTESGQEVEDSLQALADTVESEKADVQTAVEDASGITGIADAVTAIGTSLSAMGTAFQEALTAIQNADVGGELETAFEQTDSCNELTGSGGG